MNKKYYIIGLVLLMLIIGVVFLILNSVTKVADDYVSETQSNNIDDSTFISNNLNESENKVLSDNHENNNIISLQEILPTLNDFDDGFELLYNEKIDLDFFDNSEKVVSWGFVQGHIKGFNKVVAFDSISAPVMSQYASEIDLFGFSIFVYDKLEIQNVFDSKINKVTKGTETIIDIVEDIEYDWDSGQNIIIEREKEITYIYNELENPNVGDKSIMYSIKELDDNIYNVLNISFIKKNMFISIDCVSLSDEYLKNNCLYWAKFVEEKIN